MHSSALGIYVFAKNAFDGSGNTRAVGV